MFRSLKRWLFFCPAAILFLNVFCKLSPVNNAPISADSSYFSVKQFIADQINYFRGQPFTLTRVTHFNGKVDTSLVNFMSMDWSSILQDFTTTDISERKFLGEYRFSHFDDETTGDRDYIYTATNPRLFTRQLQINTDGSTDKITSIYIETAKRDFFGSKTQKLLYSPLHIIQIQEAEHNIIGKAKNLRIDFSFPEAQENDISL